MAYSRWLVSLGFFFLTFAFLGNLLVGVEFLSWVYIADRKEKKVWDVLMHESSALLFLSFVLAVFSALVLYDCQLFPRSRSFLARWSAAAADLALGERYKVVLRLTLGLIFHGLMVKVVKAGTEHYIYLSIFVSFCTMVVIQLKLSITQLEDVAGFLEDIAACFLRFCIDALESGDYVAAFLCSIPILAAIVVVSTGPADEVEGRREVVNNLFPEGVL